MPNQKSNKSKYTNYLTDNKDNLNIAEAPKLAEQRNQDEFAQTGSVSNSFFNNAGTDTTPEVPNEWTLQLQPIKAPTEAENIAKAPSLAKSVWATPETAPLPKTDTFTSIDPKTGEKFNADGTPYQEPTQTDERQDILDKWKKDIEFQDELYKEKEAEILKDREKAVDDTKRGYALWKAKFDENKANYANYQEVNTKYNAVVDEITSNMSDTGVVDDSVYQSIANKYWLTIEQVKNPNRIFDEAELTEEWKENLWVNNFEQGIEESTEKFERSKEDLENRLTQTQQSYNNQIEDAQRSITDAINGMTASGAASWLFRSTALQDSMNRTREDWTRVIDRIRNVKNRAIWDITTSATRITDDFESSISEAHKSFKENYKEVNVENMLALNEVWLNFTGEKLTEALKRVEDEFTITSYEAVSAYQNAVNGIIKTTEANLDLVDKIADKEEETELKSYNEYLENDGILLQSSNLQDILQGVKDGKITPDSAKKLRQIMQTSIQTYLGGLAPLELWDIDNINYLLEQGYTPEQTIALLQESFEKFQAPAEEIQYREFNGNLYEETADGLVLAKEGTKKATAWAWTKLDDGTLYNKDTGATKNVTAGGSYLGSLGNSNITGYGWDHDNNQWLDIDWAIGDPITFPEELEVVFAWEDGDYGNSIKVKRPNGDILRFSHNDENFFKAWDTIPANEVFATVGNTGNVIAWEGWDGSHIDLVIERADGTTLKSRQVEQYLNGVNTAQPTTEADTPIQEISSLTEGIISWVARLVDLTPSDRKDVIAEIVEAKKTGEYKAQFSGYADRKSERIVAGIDEALKLLQFADWPAPLRAFMAKFPWSDADDFKRSIETIQANLWFDELQAMRAASPTGGALWQVSERELSALQSVQGNIEFDQSADILRRRLQDIKASTIKWSDAVRWDNVSAPQEEEAQETPEVTPQTSYQTPDWTVYSIKVKK